MQSVTGFVVTCAAVADAAETRTAVFKPHQGSAGLSPLKRFSANFSSVPLDKEKKNSKVHHDLFLFVYTSCYIFILYILYSVF